MKRVNKKMKFLVAIEIASFSLIAYGLAAESMHVYVGIGIEVLALATGIILYNTNRWEAL